MHSKHDFGSGCACIVAILAESTVCSRNVEIDHNGRSCVSGFYDRSSTVHYFGCVRTDSLIDFNKAYIII